MDERSGIFIIWHEQSYKSHSHPQHAEEKEAHFIPVEQQRNVIRRLRLQNLDSKLSTVSNYFDNAPEKFTAKCRDIQTTGSSPDSLMTTFFFGRSPLSVSESSIIRTTSMPSRTWPKTTCLPSSHDVCHKSLRVVNILELQNRWEAENKSNNTKSFGWLEEVDSYHLSAYEELAAVGVWPSVGHAEHSGSSVNH